MYSEKTDRLPSESSHPMFASDVARVGGIGYVVPVGGLVMTGVLLVLGSLLLQPANNIRLHPINKRNFFLLVIVYRGPLILLLRHWLAGHTILTLNPTAKINKLTAFGTEGTDRIVFPLDWFTAGWTIHES